MSLKYSISYKNIPIVTDKEEQSDTIEVKNGDTVVQNLVAGDNFGLRTRGKFANQYITIGNSVLNVKDKYLTDHIKFNIKGPDPTGEIATPLCFTANTAGSQIGIAQSARVTDTKPTPTLGQNFQYSVDDCVTWNEVVVDTTVITLANAGDKVYFKGNNPNGVSEGDQTSVYYSFQMTGSIAASGNIMSLIDNGACNTTVIPNNYCFFMLFDSCDSLTKGPLLPAKVLKPYCYKYLFFYCTGLTTPSELPAEILAIQCYYSMYSNCTALTTPPALNAMYLDQECYYMMFNQCTALTSAPELPATTVPTAAYCAMFQYCSSLTVPPAILPATYIGSQGYRNMFANCTSLTHSPAFPSYNKICSSYTHHQMFLKCTSLTTVANLPATTMKSNCYRLMFGGCTSLIVSDTSGSGYDKAWYIPSSGTATGSYEMTNMFQSCQGTRSTDSPNFDGVQKVYYTQNTPLNCIAGDKPTNLNPSVSYTGNEVSNGYTCPRNISMTGQDRGTEIGTYTSFYTPKNGFTWSDGTTNTVVVTLVITEPDYLAFTANEAGSTISMGVSRTPTLGQNFQTSTDKINWTTFTPGTTTITLVNVGDKVYFKGNNPYGVSQANLTYYYFVMSGSISASGNIMSLIDNGVCTTTIIPNDYCFCKLFYGCTSLTTPPELPATTLARYCYNAMFEDCTSLTTAPALPATTLERECYFAMFNGCTSLTTAPALPAMTLAYYCYGSMFGGCTNLTTAPTLPATTLAEYCYGSMFQNCTSLTEAPSLPATTLAEGCYNGMFQNCTELTTAPTLPATTLAKECYNGMFDGCTNLTTAPALPATTLAHSCYFEMFYDCTSLIVSDTSGEGYDKAWIIPTSGTFTNTYSQSRMFRACAGTRSSDSMPGEAGQSYTYYTQNEPV